MKFLKAALAMLIIMGLVVSLACTLGGGSTATTKTQLLTVQRGYLSTDISAAGNLALSNIQDLAIEISGTQQDPVTVRDLLVKAGDSVKAGQVLVRLNVTILEDKVTNQQRVVRLGEQAVDTAQAALDKTVQDSDIQIKQAQIDLETATVTYNRLNYPFNFATFAFDVPAAIANLRDARRQLGEAQAGLTAGPGSVDYGLALDNFRRAQENLQLALERLSKGLGVNVYGDVAGPFGSETYTYSDLSPTVSNYLTARAAKIAVDKAQNSLDQAKSAVQISINKAQLSVDNAKNDLDDDRKTLADDEADVKKSEVVAPFDGFITKVNVIGGDQVQKGTIAVQLADPNKFQAEVSVSEVDIRQVKVDGEASVDVSAVSGLTLPAKVTAIAPTATVTSGVVTVKVKVEVQSLEAVPSGFQLREGITVTVSIIVQKKTDVLLVPYAAITTEGGQSYVQVVSSTGTIEKRAIKTGITDYKYTEVTEGLSEGEMVNSVAQSSGAQSTKTPTSTTKAGQQPAGGIMIPGMGGPPSGGTPPGG